MFNIGSFQYNLSVLEAKKNTMDDAATHPR